MPTGRPLWNAERNRLVRKIAERWLARNRFGTFGQVAYLARNGLPPWRAAIRRHPSIKTLSFEGLKSAFYRGLKKA